MHSIGEFLLQPKDEKKIWEISNQIFSVYQLSASFYKCQRHWRWTRKINAICKRTNTFFQLALCFSLSACVSPSLTPCLAALFLAERKSFNPSGASKVFSLDFSTRYLSNDVYMFRNTHVTHDIIFGYSKSKSYIHKMSLYRHSLSYSLSSTQLRIIQRERTFIDDIIATRPCSDTHSVRYCYISSASPLVQLPWSGRKNAKLPNGTHLTRKRCANIDD